LKKYPCRSIYWALIGVGGLRETSLGTGNWPKIAGQGKRASPFFDGVQIKGGRDSSEVCVDKSQRGEGKGVPGRRDKQMI